MLPILPGLPALIYIERDGKIAPFSGMSVENSHILPHIGRR
jgi:hypothetical protein